ncbi:MAG: TonB-dependent receptor domain-containing protein [Steroidobacteraceae bacterium]
MRSLRDVILVGAIASLLASVAVADTPDEHQVEIAAGPASQTIQEFIRQTGVQLSVDAAAIQGVNTQAVSGLLTPAAALTRMLEGTGLAFTFVNDRTVAVMRREALDDAAQRRAASADAAGQAARRAQRPRDATGPPRSRLFEPLEEVIVVGTFIRGIEPVGSEVITLGRRQIDRAGYATVRDVVRALPQNFGGGPSEDTSLGDEASQNIGRGTGFNLRGLGSAATLVLLDGRRIAPSGSKGTFVDVSAIPLIAIEQITLLPDGASAAYGADAVGGIVNLALRESYEGRETRVRVGAVTDGDQDERQFSQLIGRQWDSGNGLLAFEYYDRGALSGVHRAQMVSDLRPFGGDNFDTQNGNPGTIVIGPSTWAIPRGQDGRSLTPADLLAGTANLYNRQAGRDVFADEELLSLLATARHQPTQNLKLFADVLLAHRDARARGPGFATVLPVPSSNPFYVNPLGGTFPVGVAYDFGDDLGPTTFDGARRAANSALGATLDVRAGWQLAGQVGHSLTREHARTGGFVDLAALMPALADPNPETAFNPFGDGSHTNPSTIAAIRSETRVTAEAEIRSASFVANGPVMRLPGGEAKLAVGADYRHESFDSTLKSLSASDPDGSLRGRRAALARDFTGVFAELLVPLAGPDNRRPGLERLQLLLAGRLDTYEDFASAFTPKVGASWSPTKDLSLRGTWSESFRAPSLAYLDESANRSSILRLPDPLSPTGVSTALFWAGENADLREETAVSWTLGVDFAPASAPGLEIGATYFDIEYEDRIQIVVATPDILRDPRFADIVHRAPTVSQREAVCARSVFIGNPPDCLNAAVDALVDARTNNTAAVHTRGIDLLASWQHTSALGTFDLGLSASRILDYARSDRKTSPLVDVVDTEDDPLDLRLRGSVSWERGLFAASGAINHADDYRDTMSLPNRRVGSWTTLAVRLALHPPDTGFLAGTEIALNAQNVFDEAPPFLNNPAGVGYDPANADLLGRFVSLQLRKDW